MNYDVNMIVGYRVKPLTESELRGVAHRTDDFPKVPTPFEMANRTGGKHNTPYL